MSAVGFARMTALAVGMLLAGPGWIDAQTVPGSKAPAGSGDEHAGHVQPATPSSGAGENQDLPPFIPRLTDADRRAAFPALDGHAPHGRRINSFVLLDGIEWQSGGGRDGVSLDLNGWIGGDRDRVWFRAEGDEDEGEVEDAQMHLLYGRPFSRWWDVVAGVRQDFRPGDAQTWAAVGVQGLAPYWFDIEATAYIGAGGRTQARFEVEYELLLTNRLIVQPLVEVNVYGRSDPERGIGTGVGETEAGFRLRYEIRREFAPYVGLVWNDTWGRTADLARAAGRDAGGRRLVTGLRLWF